jgi:hypothetical protein
MDFRATVRDGAGGVRSTNVDVIVTDSQAFSVTTPTTAVSYSTGSTQTIEWDTAGSESWTPAMSTVDISVSLDGGTTWTLLADGVPNDGSQAVSMPSTATNRGRIKLQPENGIFFDVSNTDFNLYLAGIAGEPDAPTAVVATAGNAQASVTWSAPISSGTSTIIEYEVTSSPDGRVCTTSTTSCSVTGLTNGTAYTFVVTATNSQGTSAASAPSLSIIPATVPGRPLNATATAGDGRAAVNWSAPASNGGLPITEYVVWSTPGSLWCVATGLSCTVTGLSNGTSYTFRVYATNDEGQGSGSIASAAVVPTASTTSTTSTTVATASTQVLSTATTVMTTMAEVVRLPVSNSKYWTPELLGNVPAESFKQMSGSQVRAATPAVIGSLNAEQVAALPRVAVAALSVAHVKKMSPASIGALRGMITAITPKTLVAITAASLRRLSVSASRLLPKQITVLNATQVKALRLDKIKKSLTAKQAAEVAKALRRK